jgi:hypothetical protein
MIISTNYGPSSLAFSPKTYSWDRMCASKKKRLVRHVWGGVALRYKSYDLSTSLLKAFSMDRVCASKKVTSHHMCGTSKPWDIKAMDLSSSLSLGNVLLWIACVSPKEIFIPHMWNLKALRYKSYGPLLLFSPRKFSPMDPMCAPQKATPPHICETPNSQEREAMDLSSSFSLESFLLRIQCVLSKEDLIPYMAEFEALIYTAYGSSPLSFRKFSPMDRMCASKRYSHSAYVGDRSND